MNTRISTFIFIIALTCILLPSPAQATTGGPTLISRISYSPMEKTVYYIEHAQTGKGCAPEIKTIDLVTKKVSTLLSCDEIIKTYYSDTGFNEQAYDAFIQNTFENTKALERIDLRKAGLYAKVDYVGVDTQYEDWVVSVKLKASLYQNATEKGTFEFGGCSKDQPNVFRGYTIPDTDQIVLMISRIGDCFEGGYVRDTVWLVDEISSTTNAPAPYSNGGPSIQIGDLVYTPAHEHPTGVVPPKYSTSEKITDGLALIALIGLFLLLVRTIRNWIKKSA